MLVLMRAIWRPPVAQILTWSYLGVGGAIAVAAVLASGTVMGDLLALLAGGGAVAALLLGPVLNASTSRCPWHCFVGATVLVILAAVLRPWASETMQLGPLLITDVVTLCGYGLLAFGLTQFLRGAGQLDRHAAIDGVIVCLGAMAPAVQYLSIPAALITGRPQITSWIAGLYPVVDILIVFLVLNLAFSTASRLVSFRLFVTATVLMLVGDVGYAALGTRGVLAGPPIMDLPFLLALTALGAAALHPSMRSLPRVVALPVQPWSFARLALILPSVAAPFVVMGLRLDGDDGRRIALVLSGLLTVSLIARAVTAVRRQAEIQLDLVERANHDQLTGLPNRELLRTTLDHWIATGGSRTECWLVTVDLDGFKRVNDYWGHEVGDVYLREVARRLGEVAGSGTLLARTGGDEFALAHRTGGRSGAVATAELVLEQLRASTRVPELSMVTTASVGIVVRGEQSRAEEMLRDAEVALYRSKDTGRDRATIFTQEMRDFVRQRVEMEQALRAAAQRDEFWVAYQPLVRLSDEKVVGAEALARWFSEDRGEVSPGVFIPVAEDTGQVQAIGEWVLLRALRDLRLWRDQGLVAEDFSVSVNVSACQLEGDRLPTVIEASLCDAGVPAHCLTVELTESILMADHKNASRVLSRLREMGIRVAVDDFGTGYSSLSYLGALPITGLKIDKSFVDELNVEPYAEAINGAIVNLAGSLGLQVTAEGIEQAHQFEVLRRLGADRGQGWLWGKAVKASEFASAHLAPPASVAVPAPRRPSTPARPVAGPGSRG